jgi:Glycosyltransferase sugar-binding region containing DXD motif
MIPSILWQTWKTKQIPESVRPLSDSWNFSNPHLTRKVLDDEECSQFIKEHLGDEVHKLYLSLPQNIMRADFWRVVAVYVYGGYYADLDIRCNISVQDLNTTDAVFVVEGNNIANFFFGATPKHPALKRAIDMMVEEAKRITDKQSQNFGMHPLHHEVRKFYGIEGTEYATNDHVSFLRNESLIADNKLIHYGASANTELVDYPSWRLREQIMENDRRESSDVLFFTTFNKNGYDLYGREWISSFIKVANYYNKYTAKVYYEGFEPDVEHPSIEWVKYEDAIPQHPAWKRSYMEQTTHADYVRTMVVRFSHKAFVIQHVLDNCKNDYLVWVDGDCVFKDSDFNTFPRDVMGEELIACQVEHAHDLNHVESGILIFKQDHPDLHIFNSEFKKWYQVENVLDMGQPYDGFIIFKTLLTTGIKYRDLNEGYGKGGIQSDPNMTFCNPLIQSRFIHNIGWSGKVNYSNWNTVFERDDVYQKMKNTLFGISQTEQMQQKKEVAFNKMEYLKRIRK